MRRFGLVLACAAGMLIAAPLSAWAVQNPTTGQPGAPTNTGGPAHPVTPGSSVAAPRSPFNPNGQAGLAMAAHPAPPSLAHANNPGGGSTAAAACLPTI